jgi:hypothetical protein
VEMEVVGCSKILVNTCRMTWCHNLEDTSLHEDSCMLGCETVSFCEYCLTMQRTVVFLSAGSSSSRVIVMWEDEVYHTHMGDDSVGHRQW